MFILFSPSLVKKKKPQNSNINILPQHTDYLKILKAEPNNDLGLQ